MLPLCYSVLLPALVMVMMAAIALAKIASKVAFLATALLSSLHLVVMGPLAKFGAMRASVGWHSMLHRRNGVT